MAINPRGLKHQKAQGQQATLTDGAIVGRDNVPEYRGSIEQDGDRFTT